MVKYSHENTIKSNKFGNVITCKIITTKRRRIQVMDKKKV